ncbi:hypothetical protein Tco_0193492, partial [Tanacetum coccineum]
EEAYIERPLDASLRSACLFTKRSQELVEYVNGTCPKDTRAKDRQATSTFFTKQPQVVFREKGESSTNNTHPQTGHKANIPMLPSTGVIPSTAASGPEPRRNTKSTRNPQATNDTGKKVEDHHRNLKSSLKPMNRVDSSTRSKRAVINSNSKPLCTTNPPFPPC